MLPKIPPPKTSAPFMKGGYLFDNYEVKSPPFERGPTSSAGGFNSLKFPGVIEKLRGFSSLTIFRQIYCKLQQELFFVLLPLLLLLSPSNGVLTFDEPLGLDKCLLFDTLPFVVKLLGDDPVPIFKSIL